MRKNRKEVKTRQLIMAGLAMVGLFFAGSVFAGSASSVSASNGSTLSRISDSVYAYVGTSDDSASNSFGANAGIIIGNDSVLVCRRYPFCRILCQYGQF